MKKPSKSPKIRNLAAKALREPLFRPKVMENPKVYKRHNRFDQNRVDIAENDEINREQDNSLD